MHGHERFNQVGKVVEVRHGSEINIVTPKGQSFTTNFRNVTPCKAVEMPPIATVKVAAIPNVKQFRKALNEAVKDYALSILLTPEEVVSPDLLKTLSSLPKPDDAVWLQVDPEVRPTLKAMVASKQQEIKRSRGCPRTRPIVTGPQCVLSTHGRKH